MLAHDRHGSGPPLILIHGIGMCKEVWRPVVPLLERSREIVAVDLPGFGASPPGPVSVRGLADSVAELAEELGLERPHVAGNSLGGGVALALAASGRVRSACGLSPIGFVEGWEAPYGRALLAASRVVSRGIAPVAPRLMRRPNLRSALTLHAVAHAGRLPPAEAALWNDVYAAAPAFWEVLRNIPDWEVELPACAATIAWGEHDRLLLFSRQAPRAREVLPGARHVVLRGCGHVPMWDDPEQVAQVLLDASA